MSIVSDITSLTRAESLAQIGLSRRPEQLSLIASIGEAFELPGQVHMLEAETGTGKTFAKVLCAALQVVNTGQRVIIATHSYVLMRDILEREYPRVQTLLLAAGKAAPSIGMQLGRQAFVCPGRLAECIQEWQASGELSQSELCCATELLNWARHDGNTGIIADYEALYGPLPSGIQHDDICLTVHRAPTAAFERHRQGADTDIVVISHAMLLRRALFGKATPLDDKPCWLVIDEADAFIECMKSMQYRRCNLSRWKERLAPLLGTKGKRALNAIYDLLTTMGEQHGHLPFTTRNNDDVRAEISGYVIPVLKSATDASLVGEFVDELNEYLNPGRFSSAGIGWSKKRQEPALVILRQGLGKAVGRYLESLQGTVMMSATLRESDAMPDAVLWLARALFIPFSQLGLTRAFHPAHFGTVSLTLAGPRYPRPFSRDTDDFGLESANLNEQWLIANANHIISCSQAGNMLVITGSFEETKALARRLLGLAPALGLHVHQPGAKLSPLLATFAEQGGVLLSPSVGLGVNVRHGDGSQLFRQLVITRISYPPRDAEKEDAERQQQRESGGKGQNYSFLVAQGAAVRRLRQTFGRAIRQPDDEVAVSILDPRLPVAGDKSKSRGLVSGIPERFHAAWQQAAVLCPDTDKTEIKQELIVW